MASYRDDVSHLWRMAKDTTLYYKYMCIVNLFRKSRQWITISLVPFHWQPYDCAVLWKFIKSYPKFNDKCKLFFSFFSSVNRPQLQDQQLSETERNWKGPEDRLSNKIVSLLIFVCPSILKKELNTKRVRPNTAEALAVNLAVTVKHETGKYTSFQLSLLYQEKRSFVRSRYAQLLTSVERSLF